MRAPRCLVAAAVAGLLLSGCGGDAQADLRESVSDLTAAANGRNADRVRSVAEIVLDRLDAAQRDGAVTPEQAAVIRERTLAVQAAADLIDADLIAEREAAEQSAREQAEEQARLEAEREAAEQAAREQAEEQARLEAEEQARLEAEEEARKQAEKEAKEAEKEQEEEQDDEDEEPTGTGSPRPSPRPSAVSPSPTAAP